MRRVVRGFPTAVGGRSIWVLVGGRLRALRTQLGLTIEGIAVGVICGLGSAGYRAALEFALSRLRAA